MNNWRLLNASLTCLCGQVFLGEGHLAVSAALRRGLERAEVIFSKWLNALNAQTLPCR